MINKTLFGTLADGRQVVKYTFTNSKGATASVSNYGALVAGITVPNQNGVMGQVVTGFPTIEGFEADNCYMGVTVGRYANRIAKGQFTLNNQQYQLPINNGENCNHGGVGFDKQLWEHEVDGESVLFSLAVPDGADGFPGAMELLITYTWTDDCELIIDYNAETDQPTVCNLTNHTYFNLNTSGSIVNHRLTIHADRYLPLLPVIVPTGEILSVKETPFDFTTEKEIGAQIEQPHPQLLIGKGYDHCFVINKKQFGELALAAEVHEPQSGRRMEVWATQPGIQLYTGNYLGSTHPGHHGATYNEREGFALEAEFFPDSPNQSGFPSVILMPDETYQHTIVYRFL